MLKRFCYCPPKRALLPITPMGLASYLLSPKGLATCQPKRALLPVTPKGFCYLSPQKASITVTPKGLFIYHSKRALLSVIPKVFFYLSPQKCLACLLSVTCKARVCSVIGHTKDVHRSQTICLLEYATYHL